MSLPAASLRHVLGEYSGIFWAAFHAFNFSFFGVIYFLPRRPLSSELEKETETWAGQAQV